MLRYNPSAQRFWWFLRLPGKRRWSWLLRVLVSIIIVFFLDISYHTRNIRVQSLSKLEESDRPFQYGCSIPDASGPRENATILMLARNREIWGALRVIESLEEHFNRWYKYPVLFLNNEPWIDWFILILTNATSGTVIFDVIPENM
jgi:mannosyltransferase